MTEAIEFSGLVKSYRQQQVLDHIDLRVPRGACFGLVGVNGAGKTTLMKCLLDFVHVDAGTISLFGENHRQPRSRRHLAYLPERFMPPYYLKGRDFLRHSARMHGITLNEDAILEMFQRLDLDASALNKPVRHYSKGMAQKLGLAACFLSGRQLMVLDEPMSGLDPRARVQVKRIMSTLHEQGVTLFFSTHMLADVEELCDVIAILHQQRIRFVGSPARCREQFGGDTLEQAYMNCIEAVEGN